MTNNDDDMFGSKGKKTIRELINELSADEMLYKEGPLAEAYNRGYFEGQRSANKVAFATIAGIMQIHQNS